MANNAEWHSVEWRPICEFTRKRETLLCKLATLPGRPIRLRYEESNGHPCDNCEHKPCGLLALFFREDKIINQLEPPGKDIELKTNAELALELNISKRQVAKNRIHRSNLVRGFIKERDT